MNRHNTFHYIIQSGKPSFTSKNIQTDKIVQNIHSFPHICAQPARAPTKPRLWYLDGVTGKLRPPYIYPTPHGSPCGVLLLERTMFKFTPIDQPMVFNIMPISVNSDGSMAATAKADCCTK